MPPKPIHLQKVSPVTYQTPRHKALSNQKPRMEEETPTPVSSVAKEKSSKVSDLINRFEGGRYVIEFELVCNSVVCRLLELEPVRKIIGTAVMLKPIPARGVDGKTAHFEMVQANCIFGLYKVCFFMRC